jgi:hypothetical protein
MANSKRREILLGAKFVITSMKEANYTLDETVRSLALALSVASKRLFEGDEAVTHEFVRDELTSLTNEEPPDESDEIPLGSQEVQ